MKIKVDITNPELNAIEDIIVAWNICKKHNKQIANIRLKGKKVSDLDIYKMAYNCKKCKDVQGKLRNKALGAWSKMVHAYQISRYGKCDCGKK